ncbi:hypothetical protein BDR03DRAFT_982329 [Suillus americanus]|nr:hypothetical protein BDR03DRAFT_982329 [Suillus americanus]
MTRSMPQWAPDNDRSTCHPQTSAIGACKIATEWMVFSGCDRSSIQALGVGLRERRTPVLPPYGNFSPTGNDLQVFPGLAHSILNNFSRNTRQLQKVYGARCKTGILVIRGNNMSRLMMCQRAPAIIVSAIRKLQAVRIAYAHGRVKI